jgi:hypothetical protein
MPSMRLMRLLLLLLPPRGKCRGWRYFSYLYVWG